MRLAILHAAFTLAMLAPTLQAQSAPASPPQDVQRLPSITLSAALDRVLRGYESAWQRGDAAALAALFTEDGFVLQSGRPPVRGRAAIREAYAGQGGAPLRLRALAAAATDTVAFIVGAYMYGEETADRGKFTLTLRRSAGGPWLIFSDMDNSNGPSR